MYQVVLASESPRRREIMETMGIKYKVLAANVVEEVEETKPAEMVQALAKLKARAVYQRQELKSEELQEVIIIGADTMVFFEDHALGKPKNEEDALHMLQMLSNHTHEVYTGVHIILKTKELLESISFAVSTKVVVQPLSLSQIKDYIATGEPMDKAGAYAIQGGFGIFIKEIIGDYYNVVGFPIARIYEALLQKGIDLKKLN